MESCAKAGRAVPPSMVATANPRLNLRNDMVAFPPVASAESRILVPFRLLGGPPSVRERPDQELLFADLPEPREAVRFDDQEKDDERADDHETQMLDDVSADREAEG